jgi:hypothetical protein
MTTTTDRGALDALNLVTDNDFAAYCARLRLVLDAGADTFAEGETQETSSDPGSVPAWQARAATAVRDWYREHLFPVALDAAEARLRADWRGRMTSLRYGTKDETLPGDDTRRDRTGFTGGNTWEDALPQAAAMMLRQIASDAIDGIPWSAWLDDIADMAPRDRSDDGHAWLFDAFRILPALREDNPNEPGGEWCAADILEATVNATGADLSMDDVSAALAGMEYHGITASRYVGGTSGSLHHLLPAATQIAR